MADGGTQAGTTPQRTTTNTQVVSGNCLDYFHQARCNRFESIFFLSYVSRKLKITGGTDLCVQQLLKEEDLG